MAAPRSSAKGKAEGKRCIADSVLEKVVRLKVSRSVGQIYRLNVSLMTTRIMSTSSKRQWGSAT